MFLLGDRVCWSPSDLTAATACEFAVLRALDVRLGRTPAPAQVADPLLEQVARLGDRHEAEVLAALQRAHPGSVLVLERAPSSTPSALAALQQRTRDALAGDAEVVCQAGFFDGELLGYADFLTRTPEGWAVADAKLARQARPSALLQVAAYADQLVRAGLPVAPYASLLLGDGSEERFDLGDVLPVFLEQRRAFRDLLARHLAAPGPVTWGSDEALACGRCPECTAAAAAARDVLVVAGVRMDQRRALRAAGIATIDDLAAATEPPPGLQPGSFTRLQAQAALQLRQLAAGTDADGQPHQVFSELTATAAPVLATLPAPSPGDLFFDFEGDPLYREDDPRLWGLEYLWGVLTAPSPQTPSGDYLPVWAHDRAQERDALAGFLDLVAERRAAHPGMHVYHYAPYETAALKRLAARYQTHEQELDDLLRSGVFVDLYAVVRGAVRVSQPSYSIKKLEPLYMGDEHRDSAVQQGDASIVEYHEYRTLAAAGDPAAAQRLQALADYNEYDCLSTLRLRDWLLAQAAAAGLPAPQERAVMVGGDADEETDAVHAALLARAGAPGSTGRTSEQQAYALLAAATGYFRREAAPFWWAHYDRLTLPTSEWSPERDVFAVHSATIVEDWQVPEGRARNLRRVLRLEGEWGPGSTPGDEAWPVYDAPLPPYASAHEGCVVGEGRTARLAVEEDGPDTVAILTEDCPPDLVSAATPGAVVPAPPPHTKILADAVHELAETTAAAPELPSGAALDLLARRRPRLRTGALPVTGDTVSDVAEALRAMDDSYVAVQGPPGTGKTWTGARVIERLVREHGWRVGVVAQSHPVVEHLLDAVVEAGLDPALVGKSNPQLAGHSWTEVGNTSAARSAFLDRGRSTGCVLGGTAWTFANATSVERGALDLLVVDEAGQFALAPTLAASVSARRLLLLGDPQQLPQVSKGTHPAPVDRSALGWLMAGEDTLPPELGYFLGTTHRMHSALCAKVSALAYDGRLTSAESTDRRHLEGIAPGLQVVDVPHLHHRTSAPEEADEIVRRARALLGTPWTSAAGAAPRPLTEQDVLVVAPFNAQVNLLRTTLDAAGLGGIRVGTVDKFQGRQAAVVFVSMTASSHGDVPRGMGFLLNRNRLNVAVSRAQWLAVLVRSPALTSYLPTSTTGLLELGAFLRLTGTA